MGKEIDEAMVTIYRAMSGEEVERLEEVREALVNLVDQAYVAGYDAGRGELEREELIYDQ